jgi:hypothetical protein
MASTISSRYVRHVRAVYDMYGRMQLTDGRPMSVGRRTPTMGPTIKIKSLVSGQRTPARGPTPQPPIPRCRFCPYIVGTGAVRTWSGAPCGRPSTLVMAELNGKVPRGRPSICGHGRIKRKGSSWASVDFGHGRIKRKGSLRASVVLFCRVGKAIVWRAEVREMILVLDTRRYRRGIEVADDACSRVGRVARIDQWNGQTRDCTQLDSDRVVEDAASVREARQVAAQNAKDVRAGSRGIAMFSRIISDSVAPV